MAGLSTGLKAKLTITRCKVDGGNVVKLSGDEPKFELMLNPAQVKHGHSISYAGAEDSNCKSKRSKPPLGQTGVETRFKDVNPETVSFEAVIDGTGVVNLPIPGVGSPDVNTQLKSLKDVVYVYVGKEHEPPVVCLSWGNLKLSGVNRTAEYFYGRLTSFEVAYTLFKPSGEPLRARVNMSFVSFMTLEEAQLRASKSSPDLSHLVEVRAGDTLPLLCQQIYKDSRRHLVVARANRLSNFRDLKPGTVLRFPPLD